jgi:hypothetical protein
MQEGFRNMGVMLRNFFFFFLFFFGGQEETNPAIPRDRKAHKRRELQDRRLIGLD